MQPPIPQAQQILVRAVAAHQAGNVAQAEFLYKMVLQADKKQFDALHMLGLIEAQRGNFSAGLARITDALRVRPNAPEALINLGRIQGELGDLAAAVVTYRKALIADPKSPLAHSNLSILLRRQRQRDEALTHCDEALRLLPNYADAWNNRGNVLFDLKRYDEALESYGRALALQPKLSEAHQGAGNVLTAKQRYGEALGAYDRALAADSGNAGAWLGRGNVLYRLVRPDEALTAFDKVIATKPEDADAWFGRALALARLSRDREAYEDYDKAFSIKPDLPFAEGARLCAKMIICDWSNLDSEREHLSSGIEQGVPCADPFRFFVVSTSPARQKKCAEAYLASQFPAATQPLWRGERYRHDRIRVAYLSPDFRHHAVAYLTAGMFEAHDRSRFETTAISFVPTADDMQTRLRAAFDRFVDVAGLSDHEVARLIRDLEIDIAVDLSGLTENSKPGILAQRGAPVQVNYLGYPGTMAASYVDYILADQTVIPAEHAEFYGERVVLLPNTFMPTDAKRSISDRAPTRAQCELPDKGFVFCCFNNSFKITPETFDVWMNLLRSVDGSVLWLGDLNPTARENLGRRAEIRGVSAQRLIFAPRMPEIADHLARQRHADLFLDTSPYNAHTTAVDALWAGVPVLTWLGTTFAGRVAASLVRAIGMPELVTDSLQDYEIQALKLAREPQLLAAMRSKLAANRASFPLFDTTRFTRHIEGAYTTMWQRAQCGEAPESFVVDMAKPL
jgi:predicted O-linked N-acetylglucosamine transferase (SPINDLY family)